MGSAKTKPKIETDDDRRIRLALELVPIARQEPGPAKPKVSGAEIRAKIEANRQKRLAAAEAIKAEAGVTAHRPIKGTEFDGKFGGLAYIDEGWILSPEGQNIKTLYTVAHECGHIFLHAKGTPGRILPSHVMEWEAESYAHQALRRQGVELPAKLSRFGREYVASWIRKDEARGIAIDPRARAYAEGKLSPFEPLRVEPAAWTGGTEPAPAATFVKADVVETPPVPWWRAPLNEALLLLLFAARQFATGFAVGCLLSVILTMYFGMPASELLLVSLVSGSGWAVVALALRIASHESTKRDARGSRATFPQV